MNNPSSTQPVTKDEQKSLKRINDLILKLEADEALYGAALDGLSKEADREIQDLDTYDIDGKMAAAEEDVAQMIATGLQADVDDMEEFEEELDDDDADEEAELREDEADPLEQGRMLEEEGEEA